MLTVEEVAGQLKASPFTVRRWLRSGRLRGAMPGGKKLGYRIPESELRRFLQAGYGSPAESDTTTEG